MNDDGDPEHLFGDSGNYFKIVVHVSESLGVAMFIVGMGEFDSSVVTIQGICRDYHLLQYILLNPTPDASNDGFLVISRLASKMAAING